MVKRMVSHSLLEKKYDAEDSEDFLVEVLRGVKYWRADAVLAARQGDLLRARDNLEVAVQELQYAHREMLTRVGAASTGIEPVYRGSAGEVIEPIYNSWKKTLSRASELEAKGVVMQQGLPVHYVEQRIREVGGLPIPLHLPSSGYDARMN